MSNFDIKKLDEFYEIEKSDNGIIGQVAGYRVGNNTFTFIRYEQWHNYITELSIYIDNFPSQKRWYKVTVPIKTFDELEFVLRMAGITLNPKKRDEYFVQDSRSYAGNICYWWAKDNKGYTTDLDKAERYSFEDASKICRSRDSDKMYLAQSILFSAKKTIDSQFLPTTTELENVENKREQVVSLKIAQKLKTKGFPQNECASFYMKRNNNSVYDLHLKKEVNYRINPTSYDAPTVDELMLFLHKNKMESPFTIWDIDELATAYVLPYLKKSKDGKEQG
jgi:hypothetical protein